MSHHSVVEHRAGYHFVRIEEDYLAICASGKRSPHCKALILSVLESWMNSKKDMGEGTYVHFTMREWIQQTYMLYERNVISDCIQELLEERLILRRAIKRYEQNTFEYTLNLDQIHLLLKALPAKFGILPNLASYEAFKARKQALRKRTRPGTGEGGDFSPPVGEKSQGVGEKSTGVREKSPPGYVINHMGYVKNHHNIESSKNLSIESTKRERSDDPPQGAPLATAHALTTVFGAFAPCETDAEAQVIQDQKPQPEDSSLEGEHVSFPAPVEPPPGSQDGSGNITPVSRQSGETGGTREKPKGMPARIAPSAAALALLDAMSHVVWGGASGKETPQTHDNLEAAEELARIGATEEDLETIPFRGLIAVFSYRRAYFSES